MFSFPSLPAKTQRRCPNHVTLRLFCYAALRNAALRVFFFFLYALRVTARPRTPRASAAVLRAFSAALLYARHAALLLFRQQAEL